MSQLFALGGLRIAALQANKDGHLQDGVRSANRRAAFRAGGALLAPSFQPSSVLINSNKRW